MLVEAYGGEEIFIRIADLAMIVMPLVCCEPRLGASVSEGFGEDEEDVLASILRLSVSA
jgi:hypothetical protein